MQAVSSKSNPLKPWHYMLLLAIPMLLIGAASYLTIEEFRGDIELTLEEAEGLQELYTLAEAIKVLQGIRGLTLLKTGGDHSNDAELESLIEQFRAIIKLNINNKSANNTYAREQLHVLLDKFNHLETSDNRVEHAFTAYNTYTTLINVLTDMMFEVAANSRLTVDPTLKGHHLVNLLVHQLPALSEQVATIRDLSSSAMQVSRQPEQAKEYLQHNSKLLIREMHLVEREIKHLISHSLQEDKGFSERILYLLSRVNENSYVASNQRGISEARKYFRSGTALIEDISELRRVAHIELVDLLNERVAEKRRVLAIIVLAMALTVMVFIVLILYLYRRNRRVFVEIANARDDLASSETLQRSIFETVADAVIVIDNKGSIHNFNHAAEKVFEYSVEEVLGKNIKILMSERYAKEHDDYLRRYMETGEDNMIGRGREVEGRRKSGTIFPLELAVSEMRLEGKRYFTGIVRDISKRKQAELALLNSETRQRTILENIIDGIVTIDDKGVVRSLNHAAELIFGYAADDIIGNNVNMLMPEPYKTQHDGYLHHYLSTGERKVIGIGREVEGLRKDGSVFPMDLAVSEMSIDGRRTFIGIVRDITERKRIETMKNEFVSTVSHELRTPLTAIRGSLGLLTAGVVGELPPKAMDMLKIATNNTERLLILINDILDMQKITSGKIAFKFLNIPLTAFLEQVVRDNETYAREHHASIRLVKSIDGARVYADKDRLMQVMANLISNAAKFSPEGDVIEISMARHNDRLRISVTDHGEGIPEEFKDKLFDQFTQSDTSTTRKKGGTGLGLSISKIIIEKHGGEIDFVSEMGIGTTFFVDLPELSSDEINSSVEAPRQLDATKGACVLIVEDDHDIAALMRRMLAEEGFNCDVAYDAAEARRLLSHNLNQYRVITMDLILPGLDGVSFMNELRENEATRHIPIVVVSVKADEARRGLSGAALSVSDWLQKPIDHKRLIEAVQLAAGPCGVPSVLHVEDEADIHEVVKGILQNHCELTWTTTFGASEEVIEKEHFDLVLLDIGLPDGSGLDLLEVIERQLPPPRVVIFSAYDVNEEISKKVNAVLAKSSTSNMKLAEVINEVINAA
ncbi:PAS domain S-box protein [Sulfuriflexus mobilis]|uniref:PAS domain S-box protein n=1 Tax=Sulfuriflexus mobilis TaxID=1811807 RepID=UPI000F828C73|nr:PAS domain S-box protein [Sulfuriflexus mobilis]